ncbi:MAG: glycine betaine ABC transporter substrate-binding protein, partial [Edaphobacter sp.]
MRYPPPRRKVCKVFGAETLGLDFEASGRNCGLERCNEERFGGLGYVKWGCFFGGVSGREGKGIPQGLKSLFWSGRERTKAKALVYLEAMAKIKALDYLKYPFGSRVVRGHRAELARFVVLLAVLGIWLVGCAPPRSSRITIGAKNFTEQVVLGELVAQEIEAVSREGGKPGERVDRRFYLAGSYLCQQALVSGRIDGYVEYTGTALTAILKQPLPPLGQRDEAAVFRRVSDLYASRYGVKVEPGLGFENTFAMVVRG